jgi:hypothetical protein
MIERRGATGCSQDGDTGGSLARVRRAARWTGIGALGLIAVFLVGRAVVEVVGVDPSDPASYRDDWGGPTYPGVLAVHAGPGVVVLAVLLWWWVRRVRARRKH